MRKRNDALTLVPPVHRATHRIGLYIQGRRPALDATQGEAHVLAHLHGSGPCAIADLHQAFAHRRSTLTSILDRLAARGLLLRKVRPEDRRSFRVSLTPRGRSLAARVHGALARLETAVRRRVGRADLRGFQRVVAALQAAARG